MLNVEEKLYVKVPMRQAPRGSRPCSPFGIRLIDPYYDWKARDYLIMQTALYDHLAIT